MAIGENTCTIHRLWQRYRSHLVALLTAVAITALIIAFRRELAGLAGYGYIGVFFISLLGNATVIVPVPSLVVVFAGGGVLNPLLVGVVAGLGEPLGELTGYLAGYGGSAVVEDRKRFRRVQEWMGRRGFLTILVLAAIPNPLFDLAGMSAGMLHYPVTKFLIACWIGKTAKAIAIAYLGSGLFGAVAPWFGG